MTQDKFYLSGMQRAQLYYLPSDCQKIQQRWSSRVDGAALFDRSGRSPVLSNFHITVHNIPHYCWKATQMLQINPTQKRNNAESCTSQKAATHRNTAGDCFIQGRQTDRQTLPFHMWSWFVLHRTPIEGNASRLCARFYVNNTKLTPSGSWVPLFFIRSICQTKTI